MEVTTFQRLGRPATSGLAAGELRLPLRRYPLANVVRAWADLRTGRAGGGVVLLQ